MESSIYIKQKSTHLKFNCFHLINIHTHNLKSTRMKEKKNIHVLDGINKLFILIKKSLFYL